MASAIEGRSSGGPGPQRLGGGGGDLTRVPDLAHGAVMAGPVRTRRPAYVDLLPPCNAGCPAGENIQAWLAEQAAGRSEQAWRILAAENPLPAIHGRVCYHPCETSCNRAELDDAVSIHAVERFLGDLALERGCNSPLRPPPRAGGCWSSALGPAGSRPPTTWRFSVTRWRSETPVGSPEG